MKMYVIVSNLYEPKGGFYKYADPPSKNPYMMTYQRNEREEFILKWKYILENESYFDKPKCYFVDFENVSILEITNRLEELEKSI